MLLPDDPMLVSAKWRMMGAETKGGVGCRGDGAAEWLKLIVEVLVMRVELTMQEVLLEHSDLLRDLWDLSKGQLEE